MTREQLSQILDQEERHQSALDILDNREMEVFSLMQQGSPSSYICKEMQITPEQLAEHKKNIQSKFDLKNEVQLIQFVADKSNYE
jgi:DNA-binding NarL/FixJ family response regulator